MEDNLITIHHIVSNAFNYKYYWLLLFIIVYCLVVFVVGLAENQHCGL
jgi:hypothetical protein